MTDPLGSLATVLDSLPPLRCLASKPLIQEMISPDHYLSLFNGPVGLPSFAGPWSSLTTAQIESLAVKLVGTAHQADRDPTPVIAALSAAAADPAALPGAFNQLVSLSWPSRWKVLETLGAPPRSPLAQPEVHPDVVVPTAPTVLDQLDPVTTPAVAAVGNDEASATIIAALLARGDHGTLLVNEVTHWWGLVTATASLTLRTQCELWARLGVPIDVAEGLTLLLDAERTEMAAAAPHVMAPAVAPVGPLPAWLQQLEDAWKAIDRNKDTFHDPIKADPKIYAMLLGSKIHQIIAAAYTAAHVETYQEAPTQMWMNSHTIGTIVKALEERFNEEFSEIIAVALALSRPDIFELGFNHGQPPGWVYEIKPWRSERVAIAEAAFYAAVLTECNVPVIPGPETYGGAPVPGTVSAAPVPCPGGWVVWTWAGPGAIAYKVRRASEEALKARKVVPVEKSAKDELTKLIASLKPSQTTTDIATGIGLLALLYALLQGLQRAPAYVIPP